MEYPIVWSVHSENTYEELIDNLPEGGKDAKASKLIDRVEEILFLLKTFPEMFAAIKADQQVRKVVLTPDINLYYWFRGA